MKKSDFNQSPAIAVIGLTNSHGIAILAINHSDEKVIYRLTSESKARQGAINYSADGQARFNSCIGMMSLADAMTV